MSVSPGADVLGLGYFAFGVTDASAWRAFLVDALGLTAGEDAGAYRMDARVGRVFVVDGADDDLVALGVEARDARAVEAIASRARAAGGDVREGGPSALRGVGPMIRLTEPGGSLSLTSIMTSSL